MSNIPFKIIRTRKKVTATAFLRSAAPSVFYLKAAVFQIISITMFEDRTAF